MVNTPECLIAEEASVGFLHTRAVVVPPKRGEVAEELAEGTA